MEAYFVGVDVGTASVRAGVFNQNGKMIAIATNPITIFEPAEDFYEQSSENIWQACCECVKTACENVDKKLVAGIGFDATCSLVVLDDSFQPVSVSPSGKRDWNIIMWLDHRAHKETEVINNTKHEVLQYVGGKVSLEMQTPKLLWLKQNLKQQCWDKAHHFFDLPDYMTFRATGSLSRSLCSAVCKWTYLVSCDGRQGWQKDFFTKIGLQDLAENDFSKAGQKLGEPGKRCGEGLSVTSADELGLLPGTPVATSIIDAHAGGIGCLACQIPCSDRDDQETLSSLPLSNRLALISGTSACHMALSESAKFVPGVWGPYYSAMVPPLWLNEAGQSAAGKLIDHVVENHAAYSWVEKDAEEKKQHIHDVLSDILKFMAEKSNTSVTELTTDFHLYPDFHGNRSPLADASIKGMICGLTLQSGAENLALHYLATIQALAYSSRHILEALREVDHDIKVIHMCGGLSKNKLYVQTHADVTGLPVVIPDENESVLLGSAILGACASGKFSSIQDAMRTMGGEGQLISPNREFERFHGKKYQVYLKMLQDQQAYSKIMQTS